MLSFDDFDQFCAALPATNKVIQWGGAHVWKVGSKVFAIGGWSEGSHPYVTFKCPPEGYDILVELPGVRPAPYLASRGLKWVQVFSDESISDEALCQYLENSHKLAAKNLSKRKRTELGLDF